MRYLDLIQIRYNEDNLWFKCSEAFVIDCTNSLNCEENLGWKKRNF